MDRTWTLLGPDTSTPCSIPVGLGIVAQILAWAPEPSGPGKKPRTNLASPLAPPRISRQAASGHGWRR